jgi:hypothetical protein
MRVNATAAGVLVAVLVWPLLVAQGVASDFGPPVCGHHDDIWGFSLDVPTGRCGERYLHGISVALTSADDEPERSIVIFANSNVMLRKSSRQTAGSYLDAAEDSADGRVQVLSRRALVIGGVRSDRYVYRYQEKGTHRQRIVDVVAALRPVRPGKDLLDYYEYGFELDSVPAMYSRDVLEFERLLATVAFSEPER